jgi:hypothetical protein
LKGNPVTRFKEFDGYVAAFLPNLMYFEFKMVDSQLRKQHTESNQGEIFKVLGREQREEMRLSQTRELAATAKMERAAFINCLKGDDLLQMMFSVEATKEEVILRMPQAKGGFQHTCHTRPHCIPQRPRRDSRQSSWGFFASCTSSA